MATPATMTEDSSAQASYAALGPKPWHRKTPRTIAQICRPGLEGESWQKLQDYFAERPKPVGIGRLLPGKSWPLAWALPTSVANSPSGALVERLGKLRWKISAGDLTLSESLQAWLTERAQTAATEPLAYETLAIAYALPKLTQVLSADLWWKLTSAMVTLVHEAEKEEFRATPLTGQLLIGELPLALSHLLPELQACRDLSNLARQTLTAGPLELLDGEGLPHATNLGLLRPLLACWTRCRAMAEKQKQSCFTSEALEQYDWLVRGALQTARHDGRMAFSDQDDSSGDWSADLFAAAIRFADDSEDRILAGLALPGQKKLPIKRGVTLPLPADHSGWSSLAIMRPSWERTSERLLVDYAGQRVRIELDSGRQVLLSGEWTLELKVDGQPALIDDAWEEICWVSDEDVDYLEIEAQFQHGIRVQRQILLARKDRIVFLGDAVLGATARKIEYAGGLPLAAGIQFNPAEESREGYLAGEGRPTLVMPLALPEWRADSRGGSLVQREQELALRQQLQGRNAYGPLLIDLDPRRLGRPLTWRQLTVAQHLQIQPAEVAVGYRAQVGKEQWLFYRSLDKPANRTVLGQNLSTEFLAARFDQNGDADQLIEIE